MEGWGVKEAAKARGQAKTYSGKIAEKSKPPTVITQKAIDRVPNVEIPNFTDEQNRYIQAQHKELLQFARDENDNKEVAFIFNRDFSSKAVEKGVSDSLTFSSKESYNLLNNQSNLFVMHNHPGNSSFSNRDIKFVIQNENILSLSIVKNNGDVEILTKSSNYDSIKAKNILARNYKKYVKTNTAAEMDKAIQSFLKESGGILNWIK